MKNIIIMVCCLYAGTTFSQNQLDTIYANNQKAIALFFPSPIRQATVGNERFAFSYNKETAQTLGLLQASPGAESNLLAITQDGRVYSYIVKYAKNPQQLTYFINARESIGNENPQKDSSKAIHKPFVKTAPDTAYFRYYSQLLLAGRPALMARKQRKGIHLEIQKIAYMHSETYLVVSLENTSGIDFDIAYLYVYKTVGSARRKASYQKELLKVLYAHQLPSILKKNQGQQLVLVVPKFVLGKNEKLQFELRELHGSRRILLTYQ